MIEKAIELHVDVVAVTDHNSCDSMAHFVKPPGGAGFEILPGFELGSREGVHVLCIYPPTTTGCDTWSVPG